MSAIPKVIHYCWFGGKPLPASAKKYIKSWEKFFPGYEIRRWDESNFDVNAVPYTAAAYSDRKYAFVSDYARFWIIYNHGGIYFDTDVEVIRPMQDIIDKGPFMGEEIAFTKAERNFGVAAGLGIGAAAGLPLYKTILDSYETAQYGETDKNGRTLNIVDLTTRLLAKYGWQDKNEFQQCAGIDIYPTEYFCPFKLTENGGVLDLTENTRTIHHYAGSWLPKSVIWKNRIGDLIGRRAMGVLCRIKQIVTQQSKSKSISSG